MNDYMKKQIANRMEPIFRKMKIGDRGIFDDEGEEYFIAKNLPKLTIGAYRDRKYILPIEYIDDIQKGLKLEAGFQITAGYFGSHFSYHPPDFTGRKADTLADVISKSKQEKDGREKCKSADEKRRFRNDVEK